MAVMDRKTLLTNFQRQMDEDAASFFLGAGMSRPSGFVNWKELMREIAEELGLDVSRETDLIAVAQWHMNRRKTRHRLNQLLVEEFTREAKLTENHHLIAALPVSTLWTTNYDHVLEEAYAQAHKRLDTKRRPEDLAVTKPRCHATLYKMHGDVDLPDEAVLTKDDYATFESRRSVFSVQLRGHLVPKSFLFLGYSFSDPSMDHILSRIRASLGNSKREHYCVMRKVTKEPGMTDADADYQSRLLELRIDDLQNYGIQTLLVADHAEVTELLLELNRGAVRKNVFVSGSAADFGPLGRSRLETFAGKLGTEIIRRGYNLVSGFGLGVGGAVAIGALEEVYRSPSSQIEDRVIFRPFPQVAPTKGTKEELWDRHRREMVSKVGFAIFIAGNKVDPASGQVVEGAGVVREFELAVERGAVPIPVGVTGHAAERLAKVVLTDAAKYYGGFAPNIVPQLRTLLDAGADDATWLDAIFAIMKVVAPK